MNFDEEYWNREYNARAMIPEHPRIFERWERASRATLDEEQRSGRYRGEFAYGETSAEKLDLFLPVKANAPLLVFFHGGYWRSLDKKDFHWIAPSYLDEGIGVAIPNYGLAPALTLEEIVRQALRSLAFLWRAGPRLGFDRTRIIVAGHSAGAQLAAMTMAAIWPSFSPDLPKNLVKAGILLSGVYDLEPLMKASFLTADLGLTMNTARKVSPIHLPQAQNTPVVFAVGQDESVEFHRQTESMAQAWSESVVEVMDLAKDNHLTICDRFAEPGSALFESVLKVFDLQY